jgi:hypothetical protein
VLLLFRLLLLLLPPPAAAAAAVQAWLNMSQWMLGGSACLFQVLHRAVQRACRHNYQSSSSSSRSRSSSSSKVAALLVGKRYQT